MSRFGYKDYMNRSLDALRAYLRRTAETEDPDMAFYVTTREQTGKPVGYKTVEQLSGKPYVCLRIPTGGGKTVMACRAVAIAAQELLRQERAVVLWLVPTNTIKTQTLNALRDPAHPYRQVLTEALKGRVTALSLPEALSLQRATLDAETVVIVSTFAALRVEDTDGRKVYEQNGSLMSHFDGLPANLAAVTETYANGLPVPSLCNVLRLRCPIIIVDEAHNLHTELSFDTLARFNPACILEFTATPNTDKRPHNVLYHVSAAELKAEGMIKMPIQLDSCDDALSALAAVKSRRDDLERLAEKERLATGEYLRPIALIQAEKQGQEFTPEPVRQALLDMGIPREQVLIETGAVSELGDTDLRKPDCPVRYIITVDKLREGWDCPFAYVLGSVRDVRSRTAVEQILGRVLRMPRATRKQQDALNHAYAIVTSSNFAQTAQALGDALVSSGFTAYEAAEALKPQLPLPNLSLNGLFTPPEGKSPAERGERFLVPQLALWEDGEPEPLDEAHFLQSEWNLAHEQATLSEVEFPLQTKSEAIEIDVTERGRLSTRFLSEMQQQIALLMPEDIVTPAQLAVWLDRHIDHPDISQTQSQLFLLNLVNCLVDKRGLDLRRLSRLRLKLRDAAERKINAYRQEHKKQAYEQLLFARPPAELRVSAAQAFPFDPDNYPVNARYEGAKHFDKHYYAAIGDMNGEEAECAWLLDRLPKVKFWVRNLERRPHASFSLPTLTDRFYPDFVAQMEDGRVMAIEYKGAHLKTGEDTREKQQIGALWQARSEGTCLFLLVGKDDYAAQLRAVA